MRCAVGRLALSNQMFFFGINDTLEGDYRTRVPFTPTSMTAYNAWTDPGQDASFADPQQRERVAAARRAIARGQALFNAKPIQIRDVKGLNDDLNIATIPGTCTTCHDSPNIGQPLGGRCRSTSGCLGRGAADARHAAVHAAQQGERRDWCRPPTRDEH